MRSEHDGYVRHDRSEVFAVSQTPSVELTQDERELFERLAEHYSDREEGRLFEIVAQASSSEKEERNS